jgi:hypothetical protein
VSAEKTNDNPLYGVTRPVVGDVIVRWSEMTPEEQERAWRDYEKAFGTDERKDSK